MIICQGCGQGVDLPPGYTRNKIQCPACGVICPVPADRSPQTRASSRAKVSASTTESEAEREDQAALFLSPKEPDPVPLYDEEAPPPTKPTRPTPTATRKDLLVPCRRCGRKILRQRECPSCDAEEPSAVPFSPPMSLELDDPPRAETKSTEEEEDTTPYLLADKDLPICPKCKRQMPLDAVVCTSCGYDRQRRRKHVRSYEPIARSWDTDHPLQRRVLFFASFQGVHWFLAGMMALSGSSPWPFVVTWPFLTAILAFVLGTYDRIELTRDQKGRVKITKQWRFCFVPLAPVTTPVRGFEGVTTGQWHDAGFLEWFVFGSLLFLAIVPAIIWWYNAIYKMHFHVALAIDHGHADVYVYRGRSQEQMNEIADALCNASGLRRLG